ncbi:hypothetical protein NHX12_020007 [Muraenolepis orangiensis]|uniref:Uncharacterized protein n=1 Tax=Muraenolepis orangiensis TaxID=630683 RepID=A0A9Q0EUM1_9TELE|nr:hypothetical protein NHX12_020007 [Muraenolepis orangiensis]
MAPPLGDHLSDIIGREDKKDIKNHLQPLVEQYPDLREKHLAAVLYFRGLARGRERQVILQRFAELQRTVSRASDRILFRDMTVTVNTDCLPFACMTFLLPDS